MHSPLPHEMLIINTGRYNSHLRTAVCMVYQSTNQNDWSFVRKNNRVHFFYLYGTGSCLQKIVISLCQSVAYKKLIFQDTVFYIPGISIFAFYQVFIGWNYIYFLHK